MSVKKSQLVLFIEAAMVEDSELTGKMFVKSIQVDP